MSKYNVHNKINYKPIITPVITIHNKQNSNTDTVTRKHRHSGSIVVV